MKKEKIRSKLVIYALLMLILFFGLIQIFIDQGGIFFWLELIGLLLLVLLSVAGFISYKNRRGEYFFFLTFLCYMINLVLVWLYQNDLYVILLFLAAIGFVMALPRKVVTELQERKEEPHSVVYDPPKENVQTIPESTKIVAAKTASKKASSAQYTPGKYIASKNSNVYHEPKCDWAKRISKPRQIWFKSKEEAWEKGYKGHSCVV